MSHAKHSKKNIVFLSLAALGVVYGDIGTSPLYAINEIFFGHGKATLSRMDILGAISLVVWSITLLIAVKYIIFVLKADNHGEGGVFALYGLIDQLKTKSKWIYIALLIIAAGLLFGDGIITPAISVISSIEGLAIATNAFTPYIVPITILILTGLFAIQSKGTSKVGSLFAPAIIVWFVSIIFFGVRWIITSPQIFLALNPYYAIYFLFSHSLLAVLLTLGAVMLAITGGEAMYADMGHFGAAPIRISWFSLVFPSLLLNYLGQGAYLLGNNHVVNGNIFFSMIPSIAVIPMVIISTVATIIASQALISGAFSLASQAISLGLFPMFRVRHTHIDHEGQIYVPFINWALYIGCVLLVLIFRSSNNLAAAYGLAVSGVMIVTSLSMIQIAMYYWKWGVALACGLFIPFIIIDATFLTANSLKIVEGGYVPLGIGIVLLVLMRTWKWGRTQIAEAFNSYPSISLKELITMKKEARNSIPKTIIIMSPKVIVRMNDRIPTLKQLLLERYGLLPFNIVFLTIKQLEIPYAEDNRLEIKNLLEEKNKGSITSVILNFGFMEDPNVESMLQELAGHNKINIAHDPSKWLIHIIQERTVSEQIHSFIGRVKYQLFKFLARNTDTADVYFGLGKEKNLSIEILPVNLH